MIDIFVGRQSEVNELVALLAQRGDQRISRMPTTVCITGGSGIGKTVLADAVRSRLIDDGWVSPPSIDMVATTSRSPLGMLSQLVLALDGDSAARVKEAIDRYSVASDHERQSRADAAMGLLADGLRRSSTDHPMLLVFDGIDRSSVSMRQWLSVFLERSGPDISVLLVAQTFVPLFREAGDEYSLGQLSDEEVTSLIGAVLAREGSGSAPSDLESACAHVSGQPIHAMLLALAIAGANDPSADPERLVSGYLRNLDATLHGSLTTMSHMIRRMDAGLLEACLNLSPDLAESSIESLERLPFVRSNGETGVVGLHDEVVSQLLSMVQSGIPPRRTLYERAIENYYDRRLSSESVSSTLRKQLAAEKLHYLGEVAVDRAVVFFRVESEKGLESYDHDYVELLISEIAGRPLRGDNRIAVQLVRAELALGKYDSGHAYEIMRTSLLPELHEVRDIDLRCRVLQAHAGCAYNPHPVADVTPFEAIASLLEARELATSVSQYRGLADINFALGNAYRATGQNGRADASYVTALSQARDTGRTYLAIRVMEEASRLWRLRQELPHADRFLSDSLRARSSTEEVRGIGISKYYSGNIERDKDRFDAARVLYREAKWHFEEALDRFRLCCLLSDWAWLEYLAGDLVEAKNLQGRSFALARAHGFGTEISEHWHTSYHLAMEEGRSEDAYDMLELGYREAKRFENVYIVLDCLMHLVQKAVTLNRIDDIPVLLAEMKEYEDRGCGILVFRGRALIYYADLCHSIGLNAQALSNWREGFSVVAQFGNSRTNVELFEDMLLSREKHIVASLRVANQSDLFIDYWRKLGLESRFPKFVQLCERAKKSSADLADG